MFRYAITDRTILGETELERLTALVSLVKRWATDGIDFIQIREKDLAAGPLLTLAVALRSAVQVSQPRPLQIGRVAPDPSTIARLRTSRLLINSRLDIAIAAGLDGVHLTAAHGSLQPDDVRRIYSACALPTPTISVSCHSLDEAYLAARNNVDLILFGPVFGKSIHGQEITPPLGTDALAAACKAAGDIPVLALGGINSDSIVACLNAGASGIAAIRLFHR